MAEKLFLHHFFEATKINNISQLPKPTLFFLIVAAKICLFCGLGLSSRMMKTTNDWKSLLAGRFDRELEDERKAQEKVQATAKDAEEAALAARREPLRIELDKHGRKGKPVTLITEFQGEEQELARLTRLLQSRVGAGGSHCFNSEAPFDGQILIQGDCRQKAAALLQKEGYKVRLIGC